MPIVPLTKLLNKRGLTGAQLLLTLAATKASTLRGRTATSTTSSATSTTAAAAATSSATTATAATASTATTDAPTPGTTPTTTSTSSTASSTAPSTTPASLALASAALPTRGRRCADLLSANEPRLVQLLYVLLLALRARPSLRGAPPPPLPPSYASVAAANVSVAEDVGAASASVKRRSGKGKGSKGSGGGSGGGGGGSGSSGGGSSGGGGTGGGSGGSGGGGGGSSGSGGGGGSGTSGGGTGARRICGLLHTQHRFFSRLDDAWHAEFGDDIELPRWADLLRSRIAICDLDFDAFLSAMYALSVSAEGGCYRCVPPDPSIAAAALGASESGTLPVNAPSQALHTFTQDSGASACFFRDSTTLTPLSTPVPVRLADPSGGPVVARSSTVIPCPAVPCGSLSGLHLPSFSANLVSTAALQDAMVTTTTPRGQRVTICTCTQTGRHLATFTRQPESSLYTLATEPPQVAATLPPLPPSPAPPCLPYVEGRQRAAPHSSFPPTSAPLQTLNMDVWGPARVSGQGRERYFLLVVDDFMQYTTVFPLRSKGQQNEIAERRIGLVMEVARTSMIHAAASHFLWPFAVRYAAHQLNLWPRDSLPETSPTLRWTGEVGDASVFRVWGSHAFVRDTSADKLSPRAIPCVFLGFVLDARGWQFYHPTSRRVFPSQDVTFDESVPFYRLFPYRSAPPPPPVLFLAPSPPPVDPLPPQGPAPSGVSQVDPLPGPAPAQIAVGSGAEFGGAASGGPASGGAKRGGAESEGAETGGAETRGVETGGGEPGGAEPKGVEPGGAASEGAESGGAEPQGAALSGGSASASPRLSLQQLREWFVRRARLRTGATGAGGTGAVRIGGVGVAAGAGVPRGTATTGPGGAHTLGTGAARTGGVEGAGAGDPTESLAPVALELEELELEGLALEVVELEELQLLTLVALRSRDHTSFPCFSRFLQASPLPAPSLYTEQSGGLTKHRELMSRPVLPVRTARRVPRSCPPPVPGTHAMTLRPSSVPLRVPLPAPPDSSLPEVSDPESDRACGASPTVSCLLATAVTDPSFESAAASALVAELLDFAAACRLDYTTALVAGSTSTSPPSWQSAMDAEMASWKSTGTYVDEVPPPGANIVDGMWIFRVKRPPGSPPAFMARYIARGFSQRQGVDYFHTFSPTPKMTTLRVLLHVAAQCDFELHSLDFSTTFLQGSLHEQIWLRRPPGFTESFPAVTQWSLPRPVYGLR
ncbi:unnamed protein product [Closterium sp. NIES-54]